MKTLPSAPDGFISIFLSELNTNDSILILATLSSSPFDQHYSSKASLLMHLVIRFVSQCWDGPVLIVGLVHVGRMASNSE